MAQLALDQWLGAWTGKNRLYFDGKELDSDSTAEVSAAGQRRLVSLAYTWAYEGEAQEGLIAFPARLGEQPVDAALFDTWHTGGGLMVMKASWREDGVVVMTGSYAAPTGPDWGWRIELSAPRPSALLIRHFNLMPDGPEEIAVQAEYGRGA
jgi:hypothetical protein